MAHITLQDVRVDFPVFTSRSRGLINTIFGYARHEQKRVEAVGLSRHAVHALRDVSLDFRSGDRVGIVGRNGAGKTTLLRVLSGVYEPSQGRIEILGRVASLTDLMLGMDFDASGYENIVIRSIVLGKTRSEARKLIPDIEAFTELGEHLNLPVRTYSTGMLLRLAFAVSTSITPEILLMDEMIGAGDAQFLEKAHQRILGLMSQVSILAIASHSNQILKSFCTKGIFLKNGSIMYVGSIDECIERYLQDA